MTLNDHPKTRKASIQSVVFWVWLILFYMMGGENGNGNMSYREHRS